MLKTPKTQKIYYQNVGEVIFARSKRARRLSISIAPFRAVRVSFPNSYSLRTAKEYFEKNFSWVQASIEKAAEQELRQEQKQQNTINPEQLEADIQKIHSRLCQLAAHWGYKFNKVSFRSQTTRWASCSSQNNISLNKSLAILPQHLIDYVLLHELAHIKVKNHSKEFWNHLDTTTNHKAKQLDKELSQYSIPRQIYHAKASTNPPLSILAK